MLNAQKEFKRKVIDREMEKKILFTYLLVGWLGCVTVLANLSVESSGSNPVRNKQVCG